MGMTPRREQPSNGAELDDLLAAYAVDAVDSEDALLVASYLAGSGTATSTEQVLRDAGNAYAVAVLPDVALPTDLRGRVLAASFTRRPGVALTPSTAVEAHRLQTESALLLFEGIDGDQWSRPVDPVELAGWTVRDLVIHVLANESLLALEFGLEEPRTREASRANVPRTVETSARFAGQPPAAIVEEYRAFVRALDEHATAMDDDELEHEIEWWGTPMRASTALIVRTFETWTHADDIRRALGMPHVPPTAPDLATMSERSLLWVPLMMLATGQSIEPSVARLVLTGPGGGTKTAQLGLEPAPDDAEARFELTVDVVDYCRAIANRVPAGGLAHTVTGDVELARSFIGAIPSLAGV